MFDVLVRISYVFAILVRFNGFVKILLFLSIHIYIYKNIPAILAVGR